MSEYHGNRISLILGDLSGDDGRENSNPVVAIQAEHGETSEFWVDGTDQWNAVWFYICLGYWGFYVSVRLGRVGGDSHV